MNATAKAAVAAAALFSPSANAGGLVLMEAIHGNRGNVSAVNFDGNTCTQTPAVWNVPSAGNEFFLKFSIAPTAGQTNGQMVLYATSAPWTPTMNPDGFYISQIQNPDGMVASLMEDNGDIVLHLWGFDGANHVQINATTLTSPIPHNNLFTQFVVYVDTWNLTGQYALVEEPGSIFPGESGHFEYGQLEVWADNGPTQAIKNPPTQTGGIISWDSITSWYIGCNGNPPVSFESKKWLKATSLAEVWGDLTHEYVIPTALSLFASAQGYAIGLSQSEAAHDCAAPWAGQFVPNICQAGGSNSFVYGPFWNGYQLNEIAGALKPADHDPCLIPSESGDGCKGE